jgi:outer membrane protein assembly factor BamB
VSGDENGLIGYDAVTGTVRWEWPPRGGGIAGTKIIAIEPGRVYVVTKYRDLITIDAATGRELSHFTAKAFPVDDKWVAGYGYASHGFVAIERLRPGATADQDDDRYYYPVPSLVFTGS